MMISVNFDRSPNQNNTNPRQDLPTQYRGWSIHTNIIRSKLWIHWQNPRDPALSYGCPIIEGDMDATIKHVRFLIDTSILLESRGEDLDKAEQELEDGRDLS